MALTTASNLVQADDFYEALINMHKGLSDDQSDAANAQLILLLANHIGDLSVLKEAMQLARDSTLKYHREHA